MFTYPSMHPLIYIPKGLNLSYWSTIIKKDTKYHTVFNLKIYIHHKWFILLFTGIHWTADFTNVFEIYVHCNDWFQSIETKYIYITRVYVAHVLQYYTCIIMHENKILKWIKFDLTTLITVIHFENCLYESKGALLTIIMSPKPKTTSPYLFYIEHEYQTSYAYLN